MLYLVKIISAWLLPPGIFILGLALLSYYLWKKRRNSLGLCLGSFLALTLYVLSLPCTAGYLLRPLEKTYAPKLNSQAEAIIVLGGGATGGTPDISGSGNVSGFGANRLLTAIQLYRQQKLPLILTGGQVFADSGNEAQISKRILMNLGVPEQDIFLDPLARNTQENALYTIKICQEKHYQQVYLVTSAFHMRRSMMNFTQYFIPAGIKLLPYPCDYLLNGTSTWTVFSFVPQIDALGLNAVALHEYLGILAKKCFN